MPVEMIKIEVLLEAKSPVAHHQETIGNVSMVRRGKVQQPNGEFARVPEVSGNHMRHGLREAGTHALLEAAGLLDMELSEQALRLLYNGGAGSGLGGSLKLEEYRELTDLLPHIALLGGCAQNRIQEGQGSVDYARLVCLENAHRLSPWAMEYANSRGRAIKSCREHIEMVQEVRGDTLLNPAQRDRLTAGERERIEQRLLKSENASAHDDHAEKDKNKSSMMPYQFESVCAGSWWTWGVAFRCYKPLDRDMLYVMLSSYMANCVVGGKKGHGHGQLTPIAAVNIDLPKWKDNATPVEVTSLAGRAGNLFRTHVAERKDKIKSMLEQVSA
jgi:hypothetical protein